MPRYKKKPVEIEALEFTGDNAEAIARWCGGRVERTVKPSDYTDEQVEVVIPTLEGNMFASVGDMIIKGVKGEFYPCKPDIFAASYDTVEVP